MGKLLYLIVSRCINITFSNIITVLYLNLYDLHFVITYVIVFNKLKHIII